VFGDEVVGHQPRRRVHRLGRLGRPEPRVVRRGRGRPVRNVFGGSLRCGRIGYVGDADGGSGGCGGGRGRNRHFGDGRVVVLFAVVVVVAVAAVVVFFVDVLLVLLRELSVEMADRCARNGHSRRRGSGTRRIRFGGDALGGLWIRK